MANETHLPIKVVIPHESDFYRPDSSGGPKTVFGTVDTQLRKELVKQVSEVQAKFERTFEDDPNVPAVAKIVLKEEAYAKSHRPSTLLQEDTCPIIGIQHFGELLTTATPTGLHNLKQRILDDGTKSGIANISTIERIEPYSEKDAVLIGTDALEEMIEQGLRVLKFKLFQHHRRYFDESLLRAFFSGVQSLELPEPKEIHYAEGLRIFSIENMNIKAMRRLTKFIGTQSLAPFPNYRVVRKASSIVREALESEFPPPREGISYPLLGIIDSGTNPNDEILKPWIVARTDYVPIHNRDHDHGSFVSGLAIYARVLNQDDMRFPNFASKIVDVLALPKDEVSVTEPAMLQCISEAVAEHKSVRVWNLSLGTDSSCNDNTFSDFGIALDELSDTHDVQFVLAAGNYLNPPFRGWPPEDLGQADRICGPADSVRGVTVGALAHLDRPNSRVRMEQPSPFTRRGPGPMYIPKPEVVHYGGNCTRTGQYAQTGIMSFDGKGNIAENIGTSFASPLVANIITNVEAALPYPSSLNLVKALVIHSALLGSSSRLNANEFSYRGFGIPSDVMSILSCTPNLATLVFDTDLITGLEFEKQSFPIPECMRNKNGKVIGEFVMTLVYDPPLDAGYGAEYCRSNVDVSLGTYDPDPNGVPVHIKQIPLESEDTKKREKTLVQHGFKWSPVKVYRRQIRRGQAGNDWRLKVNIYHRSEFILPLNHKQKIALVITMIGPRPDSPVYDQVVRLMSKQGWNIQDLQIQDRYRIMS